MRVPTLGALAVVTMTAALAALLTTPLAGQAVVKGRITAQTGKQIGRAHV